ncbi:helix-turn-helix domain-containing protein [Salinicoccus roseus]|uniref:helix-turn-helix domain-containing protein n=1 Tax=Salinicoccus roseus TaxID=45670 RepID=UPI0023016289|nr:helix-turn-helix transcriptional regulator [Salinicoccus roseus]
MVEFNRNRVKAERIARGLSVEEMAKRMGIHAGTYSKKENGKLRITVEDLSLIFTVLGIPEKDCGIFFTQSVANVATEKREVN